MTNEGFCSFSRMILFEERLPDLFIDDELLRDDISEGGQIFIDAIKSVVGLSNHLIGKLGKKARCRISQAFGH